MHIRKRITPGSRNISEEYSVYEPKEINENLNS